MTPVADAVNRACGPQAANVMDETRRGDLLVLEGARGQATRPRHDGRMVSMAGIEDVRPLGDELERSYHVYVRRRLKFRVKQIVYVAFSSMRP